MLSFAGYEGKQLGNYRLVRVLGKGGFAVVYLGEQIHLATPAAIKLLHVHMTRDDVQRFTEEARTIARLKHPHIIRLLDFGLQEGVIYLIMEYAAQGTLRDRHPRGTRLPLPQIVDYVQQIATALQHAHEQGVVHRDVKPENMLIDAHGSILLSDFGLAIPIHHTHSPSTQEAVGSVPYMAPEQIRGKARQASDQYALAVTAYEWLSGMQPFEGSTSIEVAMKHLTQPPPPLREHVTTLSLEVEQVLQQALAKEPQQRFSSIEAFAQALQEASRGGATSTLVRQPPVLLPDNSYATLPGIALSDDLLLSSQEPGLQDSFQGSDLQDSLQNSLLEPPHPYDPPHKRSHLRWLSFAGLGILILSILLVGLYGPAWIRPIPAPIQTPVRREAPTPVPTQSPEAVYAQYTSGPPSQVDPTLNGSAWQWFDNAPTFGACVFAQGAYHASTAYKGAFASCSAGNGQFDTFAYQVQVTLQKGDAAGLIVDYQPTTPYRTFDSFIFCRDNGKFCATGSVWFTHAQAGGASCQTSTHFNCDSTYPFIHTSIGAQNTLTIIVLRQTIYLYINGHSVGVLPRTDFGKGGIGVVAYEDSFSTDATFSHAKLWVLPG